MIKAHSHRNAGWRMPTALIFAALFASTAMIVRTQAAGDLDQTFGNGGKVITSFAANDYAWDMALQADGKIVVVGYAGSNFTYDFAIVRYNTNGSLDSSFGTGGKVTTDFLGGSDSAWAVAIQADGKMIVVGTTSDNNFGDDFFAVARYDSNGILDSTFGSGGKVTTDLLVGDDLARAVAIQADNKIVVGGYGYNGSNLDFALARYNGDGSLDTTFDVDGKVTTNIGIEDRLLSLALYADGRILAAGGTGLPTDFALVRYNSNGSLDTTFDTDGKVQTDFGLSLWDSLGAVVIQPDNKIVAAGSTYLRYNPPAANSDGAFALIRYNNDGSLDSTFDGDGKVITNFFSFPPTLQCSSCNGEHIEDIAITTDGKIVAAGYTSNFEFTFARYFSNGSLDTSFGDRGRLFSHLSPTHSFARAVKIQTDGKILAAGYGTYHANFNTDTDFYIARYEANPKPIPVRSDFDLDAKSDIAVFRPSDGTWYVLNTSNGAVTAQPFGTSGDIAVPGDYDGDGGGTDFAVFRPSNGTWYILQSSTSAFRAEQFGTNGDVPVPADFDGDGKTDVAVFRPSEGTWYMLHSSDNSFHSQQFGISSDGPVPGYYDGDAKADIAVFRDSGASWYIMESSTHAVRGQAWGISGDQPVQADYDGDGKFDVAVFRPSNGTWYIQSTFTQSLIYYYWGVSGDRPVPADYNGDFKNDVAVWRPSNGTWYIAALPPIGNQSIPFGTTGDMPAAAAYLP